MHDRQGLSSPSTYNLGHGEDNKQVNRHKAAKQNDEVVTNEMGKEDTTIPLAIRKSLEWKVNSKPRSEWQKIHVKVSAYGLLGRGNDKRKDNKGETISECTKNF